MATEVLTCERVKDGKPVATELTASYQEIEGGLPMLFLFAGRSDGRGGWKSRDEYRVEEVPTPLGRGFILHRTAEAVAKDGPDADDAYQVLVAANGQDHTCTCRGFGRHGYCKHHDAIRGLIEAGHLEHPMAAAPVCRRCDRSGERIQDGLCGDCAQDLIDRDAEDAAEALAGSSYQTDPERSGLVFPDEPPPF